MMLAIVVDGAIAGFRDWTIIGDVLRAVPSLLHLDLSFNPLEDGETTLERNTPINNQLESLAINGATLSPPLLRALINALPRLHRLSIGAWRPPSIGNLEAPLSKQLVELSLVACGISSWATCVEYARAFPALETLRLCDNEALDTISQPNIQDALPAVRSLFLNRCSIADWSSIDALAALPTLRRLELREAPLLEGLDDDHRLALVVARIPSLETLNGSSIGRRFREDCERAFIRYHQTEAAERRPPIYESLIAVWGELEPLVAVDLTPQEHVRVRLRCDERQMFLTLRLRLHSTVRQLLRALAKTTQIAPSQLRVLHVSAAFPSMAPNELRPSARYLHTLRIEATPIKIVYRGDATVTLEKLQAREKNENCCAQLPCVAFAPFILANRALSCCRDRKAFLLCNTTTER